METKVLDKKPDIKPEIKAATQVVEHLKQAQTAREAKPEVVAPVETKPVTTEDILKRVSDQKTETPLPVEPKFYNSSDLDKIQDPVQKQMLKDIYSNMEKGLNEKFMKVSNLQKELEAKISQPQDWTPDRLAQEVNKPSFIEAAQKLQQNAAPQGWEGTDGQWSALSPEDKQQFLSVKQEVAEARNEIAQLRQSQFQQLQLQQDETLKTRYPNYDPQIVSTAIDELYKGRRIATREDIWKVIKHDENVKQAYELGRQDRKLELEEKKNGSTNYGISTETQVDRPVQAEGERHGDFLKRVLRFNLEKVKQQIKK